MHGNQTIAQLIFGAALALFGIANAQADYEPNDNYSTFVLSYQSSTFGDPVCIGAECHEGVSGPAAFFARQIISNLALGLSGSYLQSNGSSSSIKSTNGSVFVQGIAGLNSRVDVGASVAALRTTLELCATGPSACASSSDTGTGLGIFGKVFLNDAKSLSATLSYDTINFVKSPNKSIVALSLVSVLARRHRLALSFDKTLDASGRPVSGGYGLGYSYLVF